MLSIAFILQTITCCYVFFSVFTDLSNMTYDIKRTLDSTQTDLKSAQERNSKLEKECVIYQSQLEVQHVHVHTV